MHFIGVHGVETIDAGGEEDLEEGDARRCQLQQLIIVVTVHEFL